MFVFECGLQGRTSASEDPVPSFPQRTFSKTSGNGIYDSGENGAFLHIASMIGRNPFPVVPDVSKEGKAGSEA